MNTGNEMIDINTLYRKYLDTIAVLCAALGILFLSIKPGYTNVLFPLSVLFNILAGGWHEKWQVIKDNKVILGGVILLCLFAIGVFYQLVPLKAAGQGFAKYTKLVYLIFLMPLFVQESWRKIAVHALFSGVLVNVIVAFLCLWHVAPFDQYSGTIGGYFIHPIYVSVLTAFSLFILANLLVDAKKYRIFYAMLFLLFGYTMFFVYVERTGYLIVFALLVVFLWQRLGWRGILFSFFTVLILLGGLYKFSPVFKQRIVVGVVNLQDYRANKYQTSWGYRLEFAKYSFKVIQERPFLGSGTGSFPLLYAKTGGPLLEGSQVLGHPHNEYILIAFQLGTVGLLVFLVWIIMQWYYSYELPLPYRRMVQGLIVTFIINSFCNASLYINATGMLYIVFLSVFFAARSTIPQKRLTN